MSQPTPRRNAEELQRLEALSVLDAGVESDMTLPHIPESEQTDREPDSKECGSSHTF